MKKTKKMTNRQKTYIFMVIPALLLFVAFNTIPLITGAMYSFTNYRGYGSYEFVGLRNYIDLFSDSRVGNSYLFTFKYAIAGTVLVNLLSLLLALGLNSKIKCRSLLRGVYFLPNILGGLIIGYIFSFIFTYIIPAVGSALHIGFLENSILASEKYAWIGVLIVGVWQAVAMNTIIYISGLQTIPADMYEAGMIDGANKWQTLTRVTIPNIMPSITICTFLTLTNSFKLFDQNFALTGGRPFEMLADGTVIKTTEMLALNIYNSFYTNLTNRGIGQAKAVLFFILVVAIGLFQLRATRSKEVQQ